MDTPQLFTRERLVNERLKESEWIDEQINDVSRMLDNNEFARVDALEFTDRLVRLESQSADQRNEQPSASDLQASLDLLEKLGGNLPRHLQLSRPHGITVSACRCNGYETILDHAHDIGENTLHRLNFHLTVAPARTRSDALVGVSVQMSQSSDPRSVLEHYSRFL